MKLGFFTAALPDNTLEQAAKWGAESGFQAIEIACWPREKATRRYAGVSHIDVNKYVNLKQLNLMITKKHILINQNV
jgi:sugar phosphate isomerase/epimerase